MPKSLYTILLICLFWSCSTQQKQLDDITELNIDSIHEAYINGRLNAVDLTKAYIDRIEKYDSSINAISIINPEALDIAKKLDEEYKRTGKLRPLHGIPFLVKDNINTKGLPTTAGALALADFIPEEDAPIITRLKKAGAIVLAKTNMAEWAFSPMHSNSSTEGTTRNPYNLDFVPAGSSGGTAAGVAANFATFGLGTDTGNSIRGPSSHNALVGVRTTLGLISRRGIVPLYLRNDVVGPMCRNVTDATLVMEVMMGQDPKDILTAYSAGRTKDDYKRSLDKNGLQGRRIGVLSNLTSEMDPEIEDLFNQAIEDLRAQGAKVIEGVRIPNFNEVRRNQWCATFKQDLEQFLAEYVQNDTIATLEDIIRIGTSSEFVSSRIESFSSNNGRWEGNDIGCQNAYEDLNRIAFRQAIENTMDSLNIDAWIYPSWNFKPARIEFFQEEYKGDNSQIISPHTGQPAFTIPMGFTAGNLPAGLQFLGKMYAEDVLINISYAYEQATLHRESPVLIAMKE